MKNGSRGFTLLEMLLSLSLLTIIASFSYVLYANAAQAGQMDIALHDIATLMRKAETFSSAVELDARWGVAIEESRATFFQGDSFDERDPEFDESIELPSFDISGDTEYVFERVSGEPLTTGSVDFTNEYTGEVERLSVNEKGRILIERL